MSKGIGDKFRKVYKKVCLAAGLESENWASEKDFLSVEQKGSGFKPATSHSGPCTEFSRHRAASSAAPWVVRALRMRSHPGFDRAARGQSTLFTQLPILRGSMPIYVADRIPCHQSGARRRRGMRPASRLRDERGWRGPARRPRNSLQAASR